MSRRGNASRAAIFTPQADDFSKVNAQMVIDKGMIVRIATFRGVILLHVAHVRSVKADFASCLFKKSIKTIFTLSYRGHLFLLIILRDN